MNQPKARGNIINDLERTLGKALRKFPEWPTDPQHAANVIGEEYGELQKALLEHTYEQDKGVTIEDIRNEALQTMAMCHRFISALDDGAYKFEPSEQYRQSDEQT